MIRTRISVFVAILVAFHATTSFAQQVRIKGYGEADVDAMVKAALAANPRIITHDTLVSARDTIHGNVVVVKARFILEGTIVGDLTGLGANVYLRPPARVTGQVLNVAGGLYPSELAKVGALEDRALAPYRVIATADGFVVEGMTKRPALKWLGGFQMPEYNRVDGLRVEGGPALLIRPIAGVEPTLSASIGYATAREDGLGRVQLELKRGRSTLTAGWEDDITRTNDAWIRGQLKNSLSTIWNGKDYRNYYLADRTFVEFRRFLEIGARTSQYWVRGQNEIADPLAARDIWTVLHHDSIRSNWFVPHSRVASAILGAASVYTGNSTAWHVEGTLEFAGNRGTGTETSFNAYTAYVHYAMRALADHTLDIEANFRGPLPGTDSLPMQRWTFVGGSGTLYTFPIAHFQGDRLAFVETEYRIPFAARLRLPILGRPILELMHNMGMAWSLHTDSGFEQNVGARLQFAVASARYIVNPRNGESEWDFGISFPPKAYPWEKSSRK